MTPTYHYHEPKPGFFVRCYHQCRHWASPGFICGWIVASTITFGPEHLLWDKIWPFRLFSHWLDHSGTLSIMPSLFIMIPWMILLLFVIYNALKKAGLTRPFSGDRLKCEKEVC